MSWAVAWNSDRCLHVKHGLHHGASFNPRVQVRKATRNLTRNGLALWSPSSVPPRRAHLQATMYDAPKAVRDAWRRLRYPGGVAQENGVDPADRILRFGSAAPAPVARPAHPMAAHRIGEPPASPLLLTLDQKHEVDVQRTPIEKRCGRTGNG
jgi:hypothetical protein